MLDADIAKKNAARQQREERRQLQQSIPTDHSHLDSQQYSAYQFSNQQPFSMQQEMWTPSRVPLDTRQWGEPFIPSQPLFSTHPQMPEVQDVSSGANNSKYLLKTSHKISSTNMGQQIMTIT